MKACRLYAPGDLRVEEVPTPFPQPNEVLLRVSACGVCGSDLPRVFQHGTYKFPLIPGHECAGIVENVGANVTKDWIGKRVVVYPLIPCRKCSACYSGYPTQCFNYSYLGSRQDGGWAEYVTVPADNLLAIPNDVPLHVSALTEPTAVALHAIRKSNLSPGNNVLIIGAGAIGLLIALWAKKAGGNVFIIDIVVEKLRLARLLGFLHLLDATHSDPITWIHQKVGKGVDIVFEATGSSSGLHTALESVRIFGNIILVGNPHGEMSIQEKAFGYILRKEITIQGVWNSINQEYPVNEWKIVLNTLKEEDFPAEKIITHKVPLEKLPTLLKDIYNKKEIAVKAMWTSGE